MTPDSTVFIVDDDEAVRKSLTLLVESVGLGARTFAGAAEFLDAHEPEAPGCLVLDVRMPGMSGLELQNRLNELGSILPIIFITGHGDVPVAVNAMRGGAVDFIQKPFQDQDLLDRIQQAIDDDRALRARLEDRTAIETRLASLSRRERQVLDLVVDGAPNKAVAHDLELSERTIEVHRSHVMRKMQAGSLAELVQMIMKTRG